MTFIRFFCDCYVYFITHYFIGVYKYAQDKRDKN